MKLYMQHKKDFRLIRFHWTLFRLFFLRLIRCTTFKQTSIHNIISSIYSHFLQAQVGWLLCLVSLSHQRDLYSALLRNLMDSLCLVIHHPNSRLSKAQKQHRIYVDKSLFIKVFSVTALFHLQAIGRQMSKTMQN